MPAGTSMTRKAQGFGRVIPRRRGGGAPLAGEPRCGMDARFMPEPAPLPDLTPSTGPQPVPEDPLAGAELLSDALRSEMRAAAGTFGEPAPLSPEPEPLAREEFLLTTPPAAVTVTETTPAVGGMSEVSASSDEPAPEPQPAPTAAPWSVKAIAASARGEPMLDLPEFPVLSRMAQHMVPPPEEACEDEKTVQEAMEKQKRSSRKDDEVVLCKGS